MSDILTGATPDTIGTGVLGREVESIELDNGKFKVVFNYNPVEGTVNPWWWYERDGRPCWGSAAWALPTLSRVASPS